MENTPVAAESGGKCSSRKWHIYSLAGSYDLQGRQYSGLERGGIYHELCRLERKNI